MSNTFGGFFRITTFGESHGKALGVIIDNCPPNLELEESDIQKELNRRKPGQSAITTPRQESDECEILSGVFEGKTTGTPIAIIIKNKDQHSQDYENIKDVFRPSHADFGYWKKYGIRDYRGGGRSSARETVARVMGGAVAKKILKQKFNLDIYGFSRSIGNDFFETVDLDFIEKNPLRMACQKNFESTLEKVEKLKKEGDSIGGTIEIQVKNMPIGIGSPVFGKLEGLLAQAMMSVPAVKGFEMGEGFALCKKTGSVANDSFVAQKRQTQSTEGQKKTQKVLDPIVYKTKRNANGGVLGGISTGEDVWFRVGIKPTSSILVPQKSANKEGENVDLQIKGRHDPILLPRAVPILESMTALVILDQVLMNQAQNHFL